MRRRQPALSLPASSLDRGAQALTGLRGAAALLVMAHHFALSQQAPVPGLQGVLQAGYLAVDLFFVLSGFVMARAYGYWFTGNECWRQAASKYLEFMLRRIARLWPLHAAVMAAVLAHRGFLGHWGAWPRMIASNLLMVQGWGFTQSLNPPSWSVSTEMAAYLLFPLLAAAAALHGRRSVAWAAFAAAIGVLALAVMLTPALEAGRRGLLDIHDNWSVLPLLRCLGGFSIGMLAYRASRWQPVLRRLGTAAGATAALLVAGLLLSVPDFILYPLLPLLVAALQVGRGRLHDVLASTPMLTAGLLSYALYLVHYPILQALPQGAAPPAVRFLLFLLASGTVAAAAHALIERPARTGLRQWGRLMQVRLAKLRPG